MNMKTIKLFTGLMLLVFSLTLSAGENNHTQTLLSKELKKGEAIIWYLYHSGWAVKTQNHLLIFDYCEVGKKPEKPSLSNGFINLNEISKQKVYVFATHSHSDHFDPVILEWGKSLENIEYIFGWKATEDASHIHFGTKREVRKIAGLKIINIHHKFDNIPESAFLVLVDGLAIYHAGDHGHSKGPLNPTFKENIDYLAAAEKRIDLVFTPTFGGEFHTIKRLSPKVVFPMHDGGYEHQYKKFALKVAARGLKVKVAAAAKRGDCFFYSKGKLIEK
jgi:L-ascorbate metabolism protein UlaG (beta-lactamase superfamily)